MEKIVRFKRPYGLKKIKQVFVDIRENYGFNGSVAGGNEADNGGASYATSDAAKAAAMADAKRRAENSALSRGGVATNIVVKPNNDEGFQYATGNYYWDCSGTYTLAFVRTSCKQFRRSIRRKNRRSSK